MKISRARIHGLPASFLNAIKNGSKIIKDRGVKQGFINLTRIMFKDVAFRQHDHRAELLSIRRASEAINRTIGAPISNLEDFLKDFGSAYNDETSLRLRNLFIKFGSDKGNSNSLPNLYSTIINNLYLKSRDVTLLEIGLGTNNVDIDSNMGIFGKPGASVRAFREFLRPQDKIIGADVDRRILFSESGIETQFVDQLSVESLSDFVSRNDNFDLIIDDGLHILESNINTLLALLPKLKQGGFFVVEDIAELPENVIMWNLFSDFFSTAGKKANLIRVPGSLLFVIQNS